MKAHRTDDDWNGLISLNLPIFTAGLIHADVREAWSQYRQTVLFEGVNFAGRSTAMSGKVLKT